MDTAELQEARAFAEDLVRQSGRVALAMFGSAEVDRKADNSVVTEADLRIQRLIVEAVAARYPDHALIGEEATDVSSLPGPGEAGYCWVVDPIDGTRNFVHRFPVTCTTIALMRGETVLVGVVYEHWSRWCCSAICGAGVWCNDEPVRAAQRPLDRDTIIAVPTGRRQPILPVIRDWVDHRVMRNVGSTALHMAYVAAGAVDAAFCYECKLWDVAAGQLLIAEAGGRCVGLGGADYPAMHPRDYDGRNLPFFAASAATFDGLLDELHLHALPGV